jgi:hypothetical protein
MKKLSPKERTLRSIKDSFGGDSYRCREVSLNVYQCGCKWIRLEHEEVCEGIFITGDVLIECPLHKFISDNKLEEAYF